MITNIGKRILGKYLIGQAPAYASYIAIGCGAQPVASDGTLDNYKSKRYMDFEMLRVPITSRGYVNDNGVAKVVLTAELPTEERYEITEIGVFSAGSNPSAGAYDSRILNSFSNNENWEYADGTDVPSIYAPLDSQNDGVIDIVQKAFFANSDNRTFSNSDRMDRYERCRYQNNMLAVRGDLSDLGFSGGQIQINDTNAYIKYPSVPLDLTKNVPTDILKLAFSVINKDGEDLVIQPDSVRVVLEFASEDNSVYARLETNISGVDFSQNRYFVITKEIQELTQSAGFDWKLVTNLKLYTTVINNDEISQDFYVCFDGLRLENVSTINPLYGMVGYTVVKTPGSKTIIKNSNSTNYIEFRFAMDVD